MSKNKFELSGELKRIDTFVSKGGKTILTLIVDVPGQYPQLVPVKVFGRLADSASQWRPGDTVEIDGRLGGRDYNGKVYGDIVANAVEVVSAGHRSQGTNINSPPPSDDSDVPF